MIGRFILESGAGEAGDQDKVYGFREFELWLTMQVAKWKDAGLREFKVRNHWLDAEETMSFPLGNTDEQGCFDA